MASAHPMPPPASAQPLNAPPRAPDLPAVTQTAAEHALVPTLHSPEEVVIKLTAPVAKLPVELEVAIPVRDFRVRNLLTLEPGQVIETQWAHGADMPLATGAVRLAWSEFEVVDTHLAVRLTRLV